MRTQTGISLIETMMVMALMAIIIGLSIPTYDKLYAKTHIKRYIERFEKMLNNAKTVALAHNVTVTLCQSKNGKTCQTGPWHSGAIAFIDHNANHVKDPEDNIMATLPALPTGHKLSLKGFHSNNYFQFKPLGLTSDNGSFTYCTKETSFVQQFIISQYGRIRKQEAKVACDRYSSRLKI